MGTKDFENWEHKTFPLLDVKVDEQEGTFTGYASVFNVVDSYNDMVVPGAFKRTLKNKGRWPLFYAHLASDLPVGTITGEEDDKGLRVKGKLSMRVQKAQDVRALMLDGAIDGLSIGYQAVRESIDKDTGARLLKEINLWEISLCPSRFEACPGATVDQVKTMEPAELKPYPNEHACRLADPDNFSDFRRTTRKHEGKEYSVIFGKASDGSWEEQAYRYPKDTWTAAEAKAHCKAHDGVSFEPASGKCAACEADPDTLLAEDPAKATPPAEDPHKGDPATSYSPKDLTDALSELRHSLFHRR